MMISQVARHRNYLVLCAILTVVITSIWVLTPAESLNDLATDFNLVRPHVAEQPKASTSGPPTKQPIKQLPTKEPPPKEPPTTDFPKTGVPTESPLSTVKGPTGSNPDSKGPSAAAQTNDVDLSRADAPFVDWPLARLCREVTPKPGLTFVCDNNSGGIGNIRSYTLTCLRYAIEAGITGLVLPQIRTRSTEDLADLFKEYVPFDYMFDEAWFREKLTGACPHIAIHANNEAVPNAPSPFKADRINPGVDMGSKERCDGRDLNRHVDMFAPRFDAWLEKSGKKPSPEHPRIVDFVWGVEFDYPIWRDGPEFATTFGGLLRINPKILALAKTTAQLMRDYAVAKGGRPDYAGFHLRTEEDAFEHWPSYDQQTTAYLDRAVQRNLKAAYLATGNQSEASRFIQDALDKHGVHLINKRALLADNPSELAVLDGLSWDQQGLIDFVVLLESEYFVGPNPSSFTMNVAIKRHLQKEGIHSRPWKIGREDERSWVIGRFDDYWEDWLFMYDSLWP